MSEQHDDDAQALLASERAMTSVDLPQASPKVVTALIGRYRLLIEDLLPSAINDANVTDRDGIVTDGVECAFAQAAGDWPHVAPYALIETSRDLKYFAQQLGGSDLVSQRALIAEVLARRLAARGELAWRLALKERRGVQAAISAGRIEPSPWEIDASHLSLTRKYQRQTQHSEPSEPASTLEAAIDGDCLYFLAGPEVQGCVEALWSGHLVKTYTDEGDIKLLPYHEAEVFAPHGTNWDLAKFWAKHFNPQRLATPMYSYWLSVFLWIVFLVLYTLSMRAVKEFDIWEILLWVFALGFLLEDISRWFKLGGLDKVDFWVIVDILTDSLFAIAFTCRALGFSFPDGSYNQERWQLRAFQFLSCLAPLIWFQLLRVCDNLQFFGVVEVIIFAMLKKTALFFALLFITAVGFAQALYGLDMADGNQVPDLWGKLANSMTRSMLGDPDYELAANAFGYPFGQILYYLLTFMTSLILSNVLIAMFNSSYEEVVEKAADYHRAYFAQKVVSMVRAPDEFPYVAPFNLIEALFLAPFERLWPRHAYVRMNQVVQSVLFFIPLSMIALYESMHDARAARSVALNGEEGGMQTFRDGMPVVVDPSDGENIRDPDVEGEGQRKVNVVPYAELVKHFPNSNLYDDGGMREQQENTVEVLVQIKQQLKDLQGLLSTAIEKKQKA